MIIVGRTRAVLPEQIRERERERAKTPTSDVALLVRHGSYAEDTKILGKTRLPPTTSIFRCTLQAYSTGSDVLSAACFGRPGFTFYGSIKGPMLASLAPRYGPCPHCFVAFLFILSCLSAVRPALAPQIPRYRLQFFFPFAA